MSGQVRTVGTSPKVPSQAVVAVATFLIAYLGIDLSPELSASISTVLGIIAGVIAGPGEVEPA